jgi:hypothetical protein
MAEAKTGKMVGLLLTLILLAGVVVLVLQVYAGGDRALSWHGVGSMVLAASCAFLIGRWLHNYFFGVALALFFTLHPLYIKAAQDNVPPLLAQALELGVMTALLAGWRVLFQPRWPWLTWALVAGVLLLAPALAWPILPRAGLVAASLAGTGMAGGAFLALRRRRLGAALSWLNITCAIFLALAIPPASLFLASVGLQYLPLPSGLSVDPNVGNPPDALALLQAACRPETPAWENYGLTPADLQSWAWPFPWVMLPLMVWGLWRSIRRGWKQSSQGRVPLAWILTLYALTNLVGALLHPASARPGFFPLATLAVLLALFCIWDLFRGLGERLVLAPPEGRVKSGPEVRG